MKKQKTDPSIKQEPNGACNSNFFLKNKKIMHPVNAPKKRIKPSENGPNKLPKPPNNIKSPPPIPSFLYNSLKIKFTNHNETQPITNPYKENRNGDISNNKQTSLTKMLKNELPINPKTITRRLIGNGRQ